MALRTKPLPNIGGGIEVVELSVADLRVWLHDVEGRREGDLDPFQRVLAGEGPTLDDLARMCSASAAELERVGQKDLDDIVEACREINPRFFSMLDRVVEIEEPVVSAMLRSHLFRGWLHSSNLEATTAEDAIEASPTPPAAPLPDGSTGPSRMTNGTGVLSTTTAAPSSG